ncbi:MAG: regulatory protein RecX [Gammaproteobacteria bacterium]|nr:regulatory protein RecX [Gammaproteobacteria bacterium]
MDLLARREHSRAELREKLAAREYAAAEIDAALDRLTGEGLADDDRFVTAYVSSRIRRGYGPIRIRAELVERRVASDLVASALAGIDDWEARARDVRRRRFGEAAPTDYVERAKQSRFLEYRGFTAAQIRASFA